MSNGETQRAVATVPEDWTPASSPDPLARAKHGLIGAQVSRLDGPLKVRGEARFAAEYVMEGMVYAALRYSTSPADASRRSTRAPPRQRPESCSS